MSRSYPQMVLFCLFLFSYLSCLSPCWAMVVAPDPGPDKAIVSRKLTDRGRNNLVAYAKLLGYIRHFHASDEVMAVNWHGLTIVGVDAIEGAKTSTDLAEALGNFFRPVAPSLRVIPSDRVKDLEKFVPAGQESQRVLVRLHFSVPPPRSPKHFQTTRVEARQALAIQLPKDKVIVPDPDKPLQADLGGGVTCRLPLALYADSKGTMPRGDLDAVKKLLQKREEIAPSGKDRATRLAGVILAWNEAQHFYPYFDVVKCDWPSELEKALTRAATDVDEAAYWSTLRRLAAALHDGHAGARSPLAKPGFFPPVRWDWIDNRLIVVRLGKEAGDGIQVGETIVKFDGVPAAEALAAKTQEISGATPGFVRRSAMTNLALGKKDTSIELEVQPGKGPARKVTLQRSLTIEEFRALNPDSRPAPIAEVRPGIWYVDLDNAASKDFLAAREKLAQAKGLIFDLRGYPRFTHSLTEPLDYLCDKKLSCPPVYLPLILYPDRQHMKFFQGKSLEVFPRKPRFQGKVAFLTDARAISAAETFLATVQHHKLGTIIGSTTAGTNGNVRYVPLPADFELTFTGIKVLTYDGETFHGRGIQPDIPVARTLQGALVGRDEVLERAIQHVAS